MTGGSWPALSALDARVLRATDARYERSPEKVGGLAGCAADVALSALRRLRVAYLVEDDGCRPQRSVPARLAGLRIRARVGAGEISVWRDGKQVARHERLHGSHQVSAQLDHYLDLLQRKGALARSLALRQERDRGDWPACCDQLWTAIQERCGRQEAARQMVDVLLLCREHATEVVELAVKGALAAGAHDGRAVKLLVDRSTRPQPPALEIDARLQGIGQPPPDDLGEYDQLRDREHER